MDNITPVQNPTPVAPTVAPAMVAASPAVPTLPKPSHKRLYILLAVFAVMGGALVAVGATKPDLVTSTIAWVMRTPMHAAPSDSRVLVNGEWVTTSNPEVELAKERKPVIPNVVKTSVEVVAPANVPVAPVVTGAEPVAQPAPEVVPADANTSTPSAFDLGTPKSEAGVAETK